MSKLKEGVILKPYGPSSHLEGKVDDGVALHLLEAGRAKASDFETLPKGYEAPAQKSDKKDTTAKADASKAKLDVVKKTEEDLKAFDKDADGAYELGKALVKDLGLESKDLKKENIFAAVLEAQAKLNEKPDANGQGGGE